MVMLSLWPHIPCSVFFFFICTQDEHESGQTSLLPLSAPRTAMDNRASLLCEAKLKKSCPHHHHTHSKMSSLTSRVACRYCEPQRIVSPSALVRTHLHSLPMYLTLSTYSEPLKRGMRQNQLMVEEIGCCYSVCESSYLPPCTSHMVMEYQYKNYLPSTEESFHMSQIVTIQKFFSCDFFLAE